MNLNWIGAPFENHSRYCETRRPEDGYTQQKYLLANGLGELDLEFMHLAMQMSLSRARHSFNREADGRFLSLMRGNATFKGPALTFQFIRNGSIQHRNELEKRVYELQGGDMLIRYADALDFTPVIDTVSEAEIFRLSITEEMLKVLISPEETRQFVAALRLSAPTAERVFRLPGHIVSPILRAFGHPVSGAASLLQAQYSMLEFLHHAYAHIFGGDAANQNAGKEAAIVRRLHGDLLQWEGKLPAISELAEQFGLPVQTLNACFKREHGVSIYDFATIHRWKRILSAIRDTDVPLKVVAHKMGFSHVNHFNNAFKSKFGMSPGRYRKTMPPYEISPPNRPGITGGHSA